MKKKGQITRFVDFIQLISLISTQRRAKAYTTDAKKQNTGQTFNQKYKKLHLKLKRRENGTIQMR